MLVGWIICPGPRTLSEVWQATGRAAEHHWDCAYSLFSSASWNWDEIAKILVLLIVSRLIPTGAIWLIVDDTLCHKRGAKVAFGGFFLDAVTSTKKKKNFRFGVNWVVLGLSVQLPFRPDRSFCLPVPWRAYRKKDTPGHQTRTESAALMARLIATWLPQRECWLVGDSAYLNATVVRDRPANLRVIGPLRWDAALYRLPPARSSDAKGRPRKKGERLPTPREMIEDIAAYPGTEQSVQFGTTERRLRIQTVRDILWYAGSKEEPVSLVLVRDVLGQWRDEALMATAADVSAVHVIMGYCRRWSVEVSFFESKQFVGLHDPQVRTAKSVERAHPMAWFVQTLTVLWYAVGGESGPQVKRDRPWYTTKVGPTFTDMLGALRLQFWDQHLSGMSQNNEDREKLCESLKNWLAAVR